MCQYARDIFVCRKCISVWLFTVKALLFPENYTVEFILCGGKPTMNWFFPSFPLIDVIDINRPLNPRVNSGQNNAQWL